MKNKSIDLHIVLMDGFVFLNRHPFVHAIVSDDLRFCQLERDHCSEIVLPQHCLMLLIDLNVLLFEDCLYYFQNDLFQEDVLQCLLDVYSKRSAFFELKMNSNEKKPYRSTGMCTMQNPRFFIMILFIWSWWCEMFFLDHGHQW